MTGVEPKKTILYVVTKASWGGAGRYVYDLAVAAVTRGYAPMVACGGEGLLVQRLAKHAVPTRRIRSLERDVHILKDLCAFFEIMRLIRETMPTIVHLNSSKAGIIGALAARCASSAYIIFTIHGLPQNEARTLISKKLIACCMWFAAVLAHRVIAVARGDAELLRRQPFLHKKIYYIPNGVDHVDLDRTTARETIRNYISDPRIRKMLTHPLWIGTVAELTHNKGHRYALAAMSEICRRYPDVAYLIVGEGELSGKYKTFVRERGLENCVFFTGFVPHAEELYSAFDIYLATSIKEGLPYSILEAMTSGIPIIASRVGGIPDVITHGISGHLIAPRSSAAITDALIRMLKDSVYRTFLGKNAREEVSRLYTKEAMLEATFTLYFNKRGAK